MNLKIFGLLMLSMASVSTGELLLKIGMNHIGEVAVASQGDLLRLPFIILRNKYLMIGVPLMAVYFYSYLTLLSIADLSYILPLTSISFVIGALLAHFVLGEQVNALRWAGTIVICVGVYLVASGEARTQQEAAEVAAKRGRSRRLRGSSGAGQRLSRRSGNGARLSRATAVLAVQSQGTSASASAEVSQATPALARRMIA